MSASESYALKAIVRGIAKSGVFNVGQMQAIFHELADAAERLDERGRASDAAEVREIIDFAFDGDDGLDH